MLCPMAWAGPCGSRPAPLDCPQLGPRSLASVSILARSFSAWELMRSRPRSWRAAARSGDKKHFALWHLPVSLEGSMNSGMDIRSYRALKLEVDPDGVLEVRLGSCDGRSVLDRTGHAELARLWREADGDDAIRAVIVRGVGEDLSMGGDMEFIESMATDYPTRAL